MQCVDPAFVKKIDRMCYLHDIMLHDMPLYRTLRSMRRMDYSLFAFGPGASIRAASSFSTSCMVVLGAGNPLRRYFSMSDASPDGHSSDGGCGPWSPSSCKCSCQPPTGSDRRAGNPALRL